MSAAELKARRRVPWAPSYHELVAERSAMQAERDEAVRRLRRRVSATLASYPASSCPHCVPTVVDAHDGTYQHQEGCWLGEDIAYLANDAAKGSDT